MVKYYLLIVYFVFICQQDKKGNKTESFLWYLHILYTDKQKLVIHVNKHCKFKRPSLIELLLFLFFSRTVL